MSVQAPFATLLFPPRAGTCTPYLPLVRGGVVRSLVPATDGAATRRVLARANGPQTRAEHLLRGAYAALGAGRVRTGAGDRVQLDDSALRSHLGGILGREVDLVFHFGPPRANRKPVVHVVGRAGELVAVAKLGPDCLTRALVQSEARTLERLPASALARAGLEVPRLLWAGEWNGVPMLLQSAVSARGRHRLPGPAQRHAAERALTEGGGDVLASTGGDRGHEFLSGLAVRVGRLGDTALADRAATALVTAARVLDPAALRTGPSHGDWSPQNLRWTSAGVAAWDWERYSPVRPLGYDAAHFRLQELLAVGDPQPGVKLLGASAALFGPWQRPRHPAGPSALAVLVVLDLAARYVGDGQHRTGSPGGGAARWALPALDLFSRSTTHGGGPR